MPNTKKTLSDKIRMKTKRFKSGQKTIFERENQSVFVQMLGAIFGFGRYK